jgi:hypothetical protein
MRILVYGVQSLAHTPKPITEMTPRRQGSCLTRHTAIGRPMAISQPQRPNLVTPAQMQPTTIGLEHPETRTSPQVR